MKIILASHIDYLALLASGESFELLWTDSYTGALNYTKEKDVTVAVVDGRLPHSLSLCRYISSVTDISVIYICPSCSTQSVETAILHGADDFVMPPVCLEELTARIQLIHKKHIPTVYTVFDLVIDTSQATVKKGNKRIYLSQMEYRLLLFLVRNAGRMVKREEILDELWNDNIQYLNHNTLTVYIKRIREKLEDDPTDPKIIKTIRGLGYYIEQE